MKNRSATFCTLVLALMLAGCGSTPKANFYLLTAREGPTPAGQSPSIGIGPVEVPEYLRRTALVYHRTGNQLQIAARERWAEPLEDGINRVLAINLAGLLDTGNVSYFPFHRDRAPEFGVQVRLLRMDAYGREARLVAEWLVYRPADSQPVARRLSSLVYAPQGDGLGPQQLPTAYSELLYRLSGEIADAIESARE